jgi:hypothetical protein
MNDWIQLTVLVLKFSLLSFSSSRVGSRVSKAADKSKSSTPTDYCPQISQKDSAVMDIIMTRLVFYC